MPVTVATAEDAPMAPPGDMPVTVALPIAAPTEAA